MPELPDIMAYMDALRARIVGARLEHVLVKNPFLLRTADPSPQSCEGHKVTGLRRIGKRIAIGFDNDAWFVLHLMIAGRLHWYAAEQSSRMKTALLYLRFSSGTLTLTEAGTKRRASLHVVASTQALQDFDRGGLEVLESDFETFHKRLSERNHTLKRALTDPTLLSGIGNAYSDEILHRARLSPMAQTKSLDQAEWQRLFDATRVTLTEWIDRLANESRNAFPEKVTAFREEMVVHGRFGKPCPVCATSVQRIRYADNETNYCPRCQTGGKLLADRALSRLLKSDWPKTVEEWESGRKP